MAITLYVHYVKTRYIQLIQDRFRKQAVIIDITGDFYFLETILSSWIRCLYEDIIYNVAIIYKPDKSFTVDKILATLRRI